MIWGWESSRRHRKTVQRTLGDLGPALPRVEEAAPEHPHSPLNCSAVTGGIKWCRKGHNTGRTIKKVDVSQVLVH